MKLFQLWPLGAPSVCDLCPFNMPSLLEYFFLSGTMKYSRLILNFPCPSLRIVLPRSPGSFYSRQKPRSVHTIYIYTPVSLFIRIYTKKHEFILIS